MKVAVNGKVVDISVEEQQFTISKDQYGGYVESLIRQRYSLSEELAILRQRYTKLEEFDEYNAYAEQCKAKAKSLLGGSV